MHGSCFSGSGDGCLSLCQCGRSLSQRFYSFPSMRRIHIGSAERGGGGGSGGGGGGGFSSIVSEVD